MSILNCLRLNYWSFKKIETPKLLWFHLFVEINTHLILGFFILQNRKFLNGPKQLYLKPDSAKSLMIGGNDN